MLSFLIQINTKLHVNIFEITILSQVTLNKINAYIQIHHLPPLKRSVKFCHTPSPQSVLGK